MVPYKKHPRKPLFRDEKEAQTFVNLFNDFYVDENYRKIAKLAFVDGLACQEIADEIGYSIRQIERIRVEIMKIALKKLIYKQTWGN